MADKIFNIIIQFSIWLYYEISLLYAFIFVKNVDFLDGTQLTWTVQACPTLYKKFKHGQYTRPFSVCGPCMTVCRPCIKKPYMTDTWTASSAMYDFFYSVESFFFCSSGMLEHVVLKFMVFFSKKRSTDIIYIEKKHMYGLSTGR